MWNYIRFWEIVFSTFFSRNKDNARISSYVQKLYCRLQIYILPTLSSILAVIFLFEVSLQGCLLQTKFLWQDKCHKKLNFFIWYNHVGARHCRKPLGRSVSQPFSKQKPSNFYYCKVVPIWMLGWFKGFWVQILVKYFYFNRNDQN